MGAELIVFLVFFSLSVGIFVGLCFFGRLYTYAYGGAASLPPVGDPQDDGTYARIRTWTSQSLAIDGIAHPAPAYDPNHPPACGQDHPPAYDLGGLAGDIEMQRYTLQIEGEAQKT